MVVVLVDEGAAAAMAKEVVAGDMFTLKSSDGKTFEVSKEAAERLSKFLKEKISNGGLADGGIQLENEKIGSEALEKVVDYLNKHADSIPSGITFVDSNSKDLEEWDRKLVDGLNTMDAFVGLLLATHYLGVDGLLNVACRKLADMMKGKTPVQIRKMFNIKNDYTPEQEKEIRLEYAWAFNDDDDDE